MYVYIYIYTYIHTYVERERERERFSSAVVIPMRVDCTWRRSQDEEEANR